MNPSVIGVIVFAFAFGGSMLGMWLRNRLPEHHLDNDSKDTIKVGIGLIATMTALVLGLVTASAKSSFDAEDTAIKQTAINILTLDRLLARYGPETREIRQGMQQMLSVRIESIWPKGSPEAAQPDLTGARTGKATEGLADAVRHLQPQNDLQRSLQSRAQDLAETILQTRWITVAALETSVPWPFLLIMTFWLTITFVSFGLFAPRNSTVLSILLLCSLSVGSALFLVLEMDSPFTGVLKVSADPLRYALAHINQ